MKGSQELGGAARAVPVGGRALPRLQNVREIATGLVPLQMSLSNWVARKEEQIAAKERKKAVAFHCFRYLCAKD